MHNFKVSTFNTFINEYNESRKKELYNKWKKLINMSDAEIKKFYDSEEGKQAGMKPKDAKNSGVNGNKISTGRQSARWLMKMIPTGKTFDDALKNWNDDMWEWCGKQNSFNSRMLGNDGSLRDEKGYKTRKLLSLLIWGHNPEKK